MAFHHGCFSKLLFLLSTTLTKRTEYTALPGGEYSEQKATNILLSHSTTEPLALSGGGRSCFLQSPGN